MSLSYGGDLNDMRKLPGYDRLRATCTEHNVEVRKLHGPERTGERVGKGAIVLAFAAEPRKFE